MGNRTLAIIKPDAVENQYTEAICERIIKADFIILASKMIHMTKKETESFYAVHPVSYTHLTLPTIYSV